MIIGACSVGLAAAVCGCYCSNPSKFNFIEKYRNKKKKNITTKNIFREAVILIYGDGQTPPLTKCHC